VGGTHSLVLASDGTVWAWGSNSEGQLGNGAIAAPSAPTEVYGLSGVVAISAGFAHTIALRDDRTVWAWGPNAYGQLGDGTTAYRAAPVQVGGLSEVATIGAAGFSSAAVKRDGTLWAWGAALAKSEALGPRWPRSLRWVRPTLQSP
jgi:alpha-tubulin suppressor-like RCC1 family protein